MFSVQCEEWSIIHLSPRLVVTMPYACWFMWWVDYIIEDFKWCLHFEFRLLFEGLFWERYILKAQITFEDIEDFNLLSTGCRPRPTLILWWDLFLKKLIGDALASDTCHHLPLPCPPLREALACHHLPSLAFSSVGSCMPPTSIIPQLFFLSFFFNCMMTDSRLHHRRASELDFRPPI